MHLCNVEKKDSVNMKIKNGRCSLAFTLLHVHNGSMRAAKNYPTLSDDNMKTTIAKYSRGDFHIDLSYN